VQGVAGLGAQLPEERELGSGVALAEGMDVEPGTTRLDATVAAWNGPTTQY